MIGVFDNTIFSKQKHGGISRYWNEILSRSLDDRQSFIDLYCFLGDEIPEHLKMQRDTPRIQQIGFSEYFLSNNFKNKGFCHSPYLWLPLRKNIPSVVTVHDLMPLTHPVKPLKDSLRSCIFSYSIIRADIIIAVSQATKDEILKHFPRIKDQKIRVVHHGLSQAFLGHRTGSDFSHVKPYLLYVGRRDGYKNFLNLVRSFANANLPDDLDLVVVGGGAPSSQEMEILRRLKVINRVIFLGSKSDEELKSIYEKALALIYPSDAEGFGFPILEAMASLCPVICFKKSSMAEIAADFGIWLDNLNPESLRVALDSAIAFRSTLRLSQAMEYARQFTWNAAYEQHKAVYAELATAALQHS